MNLDEFRNMTLQLRVFCYHKHEPEDEETGLCPSHEMISDSVKWGEANLVCPDCGNEVYVVLTEQTSGGSADND